MKKRHLSITTLYPQKPLFTKQERKGLKEIIAPSQQAIGRAISAAGNVIGAY